jgi:hypothetical protein
VETSTYPGVITYQGQAYIDDWGIEGWAAAAAAAAAGERNIKVVVSLNRFVSGVLKLF